MIEVVYTKEIDSQIISHERHMLKLYEKSISKYILSFDALGYSLKIGLFWKRFAGGIVSLKRGSPQNGYQCYVYCAVQKNGKDVCIKSTDGEADFYPLASAWIVSTIHRKFCRVTATLFPYDNTANVEIEKFLSELEHMG